MGTIGCGELLPAELRILEGENGIKRKMLPNGRTINIIAPCPQARRGRLDAALGRGERAYVQHSTAIDVMHDAGFRDVKQSYDAAAFDRFLRSLRSSKPAKSSRGVGKPPDVIERVKRRMESDIRAGIDVGAMKGKELAAKYSVSRGTAMKARREVQEKQAR